MNTLMGNLKINFRVMMVSMTSKPKTKQKASQVVRGGLNKSFGDKGLRVLQKFTLPQQ
jgi:hypothetical protein